MRLLRYSILPLLILGLWWLVTRGGAIPAILLPPPADVGRAALELFSSGEGFRHAGTSLLRVFAGYGISSLAALTLAAVLARSPKLEAGAHVVLESLRVVPPLSLIPLLILWLGIDEAPKLAIVVLASFFPIYLSTIAALKAAEVRYGELLRGARRLSRAHAFRTTSPRAPAGGGAADPDGPAVGLRLRLARARGGGAHRGELGARLPH